MDAQTVGKRIARLRLQAHLTQDELGSILGVTRKAVSRWECDHGYPDMQTMAGLALALGTSVDWLLEGEQHETKLSNELSPDESLYLAKILRASLVIVLIAVVYLALW